MKILGLIAFLFSSASFASASDRCIDICRMGSPDCIALGLEIKKSTQPLIDFVKSAQASNDGIVGNICGRDTILADQRISNSGPPCSFSVKIAENNNTVTDVSSIVAGLREKTPSGAYQVIFDSNHMFKSATYDKNGTLVLGGEIASIVPYIESDGTSRVVWETVNGWCYSQIEKFR